MRFSFAFFTLLFITIFTACNQEDSNHNLTVQGSIDGLKKGTLYLQQLQDSTLTTIDSLTIKGDGNFKFTHYIESPDLFYLFLDKVDYNQFNDRITFFAEPGVTSINTSWKTFDTNAQIIGSPSQKKYAEVQNMLSEFNKRDLSLLQQNIADSTITDSIARLRNANAISRYRYLLNFGFNNLDAYVTPYILLTEAAEANPKYLDSIANSLSKVVAKSKYGQKFKAFTKERVAN